MFAFTSYCQYFNCEFFWEVSLNPAAQVVMVAVSGIYTSLFG